MTISGLLLGTALTLPLAAGAHRHPETGLSLWLPDEWNVDIDASSLAAFPPEGDPRFEMAALSGVNDLSSATERALRRLNTRVRQFEESAPRRDLTLNGLRGLAWAGEGVQGGARKQVRLLVFKAPRAWVMVLWVADRRRSARFEETWSRITGGLQPEKP